MGIPDCLHGESDATGVDEGLHQVQVDRQREEGDEHQILSQVVVFFHFRPVDLDHDLGICVDPLCLLDEACACFLVPLVGDARRPPAPASTKTLCPARVNSYTACGASATLLSPCVLSVGTPILIVRSRGARTPGPRGRLRRNTAYSCSRRVPWILPAIQPRRGPQRALHEGCASRKFSSSCSAPRTPRPTAPSGTGVHDGPNLTSKPASLRSSARACKVVAGAEAGAVTRSALVSSTASESTAEVVRERKTVCRAEPRSRSERASISPRISRLPASE